MNKNEFMDRFKIFDEIDNMVISKDQNKSSKNLTNNNKKQNLMVKQNNPKQLQESTSKTNLGNNNNSNNKSKNFVKSPSVAEFPDPKSLEYKPDLIDIDRKKPVHLNQYLYHKKNNNSSIDQTSYNNNSSNKVSSRPSTGYQSNQGKTISNKYAVDKPQLKTGIKQESRPSTCYQGNQGKNISNKYAVGKPQLKTGIKEESNSNTKNRVSSSRIEKLYQTGKKSQEKIERIRQDNLKYISINANPKISNKSKNINRDSSNFEERLYPYTKVNGYSQVINNNISNSNINIFLNIDDEDIFNKYYRKNPIKNYDNFNYQPKISDKSTRIAEKLGSSIERLLKKKKRTPSETKSYKSDTGVQISRSSNASKQSGKSGRSTSSSRYIDTNLYQRGLELKKEREKLYNENKEEMVKKKVLECTFKPEINKSTNDIRLSNLDFHTRQSLILKEKEEILNMKRELRLKKELEDCSFKPNIDVLGITDDEDVIKRHSDEMNEYVSKRKKMFDKKKDDIDYGKKIFKENHSPMKPTIVNEFVFKTKESREKFLNKSIRKYNDKLMNNRGNFNLKGFFEKKDYGTVSSKNQYVI